MKGFVALTSVLIISALLLVLVVGASAPVLYAHMNMLEAEWAGESQFLARSCVEEVRLKQVAEPGSANGTLWVDGTPCAVSTSTVYIAYHGSVTVLPL